MAMDLLKSGRAIKFWLPADLAERIDKAASREMLARSAWLRRLVAQAVGSHGKDERAAAI